MSFSVRPANHNDIDWLLNQLKSFSDFYRSGFSLAGAKIEYQKELLTKLIDNHVVLLCDKQQVELNGLGEPVWTPVGLIVGQLSRHIFNPDIKVLTEFFWWVDPEHRNTRAGLMLFNSFIEYGEELCDWTTFCLLPHSPVNKDFLEKKGFRVCETSFLKENKKGG